jgi:proteasome lid subunit RPN8/RPN11
MVDEIVAHALEDVPDECCGMVSGKDGTATEVFRARNELASPFSYSVDSRDLLKITGLIDDRGEELAAIYHSHTKTAPEPSQTDINLATMWPDPVYLICSIADPEDPQLRGWEIRDGKVQEVELVVE